MENSNVFGKPQYSTQDRVRAWGGSFLYYLKEHDTDKGRFKLIAQVGHVPIITCLQTNDRSWKDMFLFIRGELVWGPRKPGGVSGH